MIGLIKRHKTMLSPTRQIIISFLLVIMLGAGLLSLPFANAVAPLTFLDYLFIATSATCVTGLFPVEITDQFTLWGQLIILILMQIGGLGFLTFLYLLLGKIQKKLTLRRKMVLQEMLNYTSISNSSLMLRRILTYTFATQGIGVLLFMPVFVSSYGMLRGLYYSIFHSVSSFTNAGITVFSTSSLMTYRHHPYMLMTTSLMIILGGLGFIVWYDFLQVMQQQKTSIRPFSMKRLFTKLSLHSKIVMVMTGFLLVSGALLLFILERNNVQTIGEFSMFDQLLNSFFLSVSSRTAGFTTFSTEYLNISSQLILWLYMFIGGSPTGTAGGIKTTTFMMTVLMIYYLYQGKKEIQIFKRSIHQKLVIRCFAIVSMALFVIFAALIMLSYTENIPFIHLTAEVLSAFTTVGFSHQITANLTVIGYIIFMLLMFVGRLGPITMLISFVNKSQEQKEKKEVGYPKEDFIMG